MHCTDFQVWPCGACGPRRRDWRGLDFTWLFPWKHQLCCSLSARGFSAGRCFFFLSGQMHRTLSGTGEVSFLRHCDGDFFTKTLFSVCVCVICFSLTVPFQYGRGEGMRINKYGPRLRIFLYG